MISCIKILGEADIFSPLYGVGEVDKTLIMYSIIIADIAPMTPGDLMHFNWPRLLRNKPTYRVYYKTYHTTVYTCMQQEYTENSTFSLGSK